MIVRVGLRGWVIHYINESPYKDRTTRMCVTERERECVFRVFLIIRFFYLYGKAKCVMSAKTNYGFIFYHFNIR